MIVKNNDFCLPNDFSVSLGGCLYGASVIGNASHRTTTVIVPTNKRCDALLHKPPWQGLITPTAYLQDYNCCPIQNWVYVAQEVFSVALFSLSSIISLPREQLLSNILHCDRLLQADWIHLRLGTSVGNTFCGEWVEFLEWSESHYAVLL